MQIKVGCTKAQMVIFSSFLKLAVDRCNPD